MLKILLLIATLLLIAGCDYFDDDTIDPIIYDSTPVVIPTDADWDLIATLERNPLRPAEFYIFDWQAEAINTAYLDGKHFIFEIGREHREMYTIKIRHYIIQPTPPFRDEDKHPGQLNKEKQDGGKWYTHYYFFLSEGWYVSEPNSPAVGFGVEFEDFVLDGIRKHSITIGLINTLDNPIIGRGPSYIEGDKLLRIYVSK